MADGDVEDEQAREEMAAELARYAGALRGIAADDRKAFAVETRPHLERVEAIRAAQARRG